MTKPLEECHIHIIGLGLMGASLALVLQDKVAHLSGSDINHDIERQALADGVIRDTDSIHQADIVLLAMPTHFVTEVLCCLTLKTGALVMDLGSTKTKICDYMDTLPEGIQAVGGHPMCGLAENGYRNAIPNLYNSARFILCETTRTTLDARELSQALVRASGAIPLWLDRARHDHLAGAISHIPHLMSFALMRMAMQLAEADDHVYELAAGGFDGATRLARTDEAMITGMFRTNAEELRRLTALLQQHLDELTALLDDPEGLRQELTSIVAARRWYTQNYGERLIT